ncbi:MAG: hypothetical protein QM655_10605 [Nocardioidaceae bacterium]
MTDLRRTLRVTCMPWDFTALLRTGEVRPEGWDLDLVTHDRVWDWRTDESFDGGELSLSRHVQALRQGDDRVVALPLFVMRSFRQRCVLVPRASDRYTLGDLVGARIGVPGWADTGNTWTRALLREAGIGLDAVDWTVGLAFPGAAQTIHRDSVPSSIRFLSDSENIFDELLAGRLDGLFFPFLPAAFHRGDFPLRHLFADFVAEERAYFDRTGYVPGLHLIGVRRTVLERRPGLAAEFFELFGRARRTWIDQRTYYADTTPWFLSEVERSATAFAGDWLCDGVEGNRRMVEAFCAELFEQGIVNEPVDAGQLFSDYESFATE